MKLKIVQTKAILFLKSMSEKVGSDIERLSMILFQSRCMSDPTLSDIDFKNKMVLVGTTLNNLDFSI